MILILMQSRSGSSLVASIFNAHGFDTKHTRHVNQFKYLDYEHQAAKNWCYARKEKMGYQTCKFVEPLAGIDDLIEINDCVKIGIEYWPVFRHLQPKVFCVRRDPLQIAKSLQAKRTKRNRELMPDDEMWRSIRIRENMLDQARKESGGIDIHVQPIMDGDFTGIEGAFNHHGLEFNPGAAKACIQPQKWRIR